MAHLKPSLRYERSLWQRGYQAVAGVDEVGRGAWAGPIVAAAVVLTRERLAVIKKLPWFGEVNDSKRLSRSTRERIFNSVCGTVPWAIGVVSNKQIDAVGIAVANQRAMALAVFNLKQKPEFVLADYVANLGPVVAGTPCRCLVGGDARVFVIALASIVAKVQRDQLMRSYAQKYPGYGLADNVGYGTQAHRRALARLGVLPIHRRTYRPVRACLVY